MKDIGPPLPPHCLHPMAPALWHAAGRGSSCFGCHISLGCVGWGLPISRKGSCPKLGHDWCPDAMLPFLPLKAVHGEQALATKNKTTLFLLFTLSEKQHRSFIFSSHLVNKTIPSLGWPCRGSLAGAPSGPHNGCRRPLKLRQPWKRQEEPGRRPWAWPGLIPILGPSVPLLRGEEASVGWGFSLS